ncbi:hypothetical protein [Gimesia sp.]|uniref:hypothetical protein n=1 Tax=Gimesia sp. TaxID=2024833 RepID=UPI003A91EE9C
MEELVLLLPWELVLQEHSLSKELEHSLELVHSTLVLVRGSKQELVHSISRELVCSNVLVLVCSNVLFWACSNERELACSILRVLVCSNGYGNRRLQRLKR